jgi:hypothetical protein
MSSIETPRSHGSPLRRLDTGWVCDGIAAGTVAALGSGLPSTLHALATGVDPLAASAAAGSMVLPHEERTSRLLIAAAPVHFGLSLGWGVALAAALPRRRTVIAGALAGLMIAALDLRLIGGRFKRIRSLPLAPQVADHVAYGALVGAVLQRRRACRPGRMNAGKQRAGTIPRIDSPSPIAKPQIATTT